MTRQYRIERLQGVEVLVCEFYAKHTWDPQEVEAFSRFFDCYKEALKVTRDDFRIELDEWLAGDHAEGQTFYGLTEPIPVYEYSPHMVIRGAIVNNRIASLAVDYAASVSHREVLQSIEDFYMFQRSPHWRNSIQMAVQKYGSLFGPDNDSESCKLG